GSLSYIEKIEATSVQVMKHPGARALCNIAVDGKIIIKYNHTVSWGMHVQGTIHLGDAFFSFPDSIRPFTVVHELGHVAQHSGNFYRFFDEQFGSNNWPYIETYSLTGFAHSKTESQAEAMGLTMFADMYPEHPCPYAGCSYDIRKHVHDGKNVAEVVHQ